MGILQQSLGQQEIMFNMISHNPMPNGLKSDKLGLELEMNTTRALIEALKAGKPVLMTFRSPLARALGFTWANYPMCLAYLPDETLKLLQNARDLGMPEVACDHLITINAAFITGKIPPPSLVMETIGECPVITYGSKLLGSDLDVPVFRLDIPLDYNEENMGYLASQMEDFIHYAERKVPGIKYDKDKHLELIEMDRFMLNCLEREWELKKNVPFPLSNMDSFMSGAFLLSRSPSALSEPARAVEYWRMRLEEIEERVASSDPEMKQKQNLRLFWTFAPPVYINSLAVLNLLDSRGIVVAVSYSGWTPFMNGRIPGIGDEKEFGRKLSPLEEEARMILGCAWRGRGNVYVDEAIWAAQDMGCDAIICTQLIDCTITASLGRLVAEKAEKELGIPTLIIPCKAQDSSVMPEEEYMARLKEFLDMVLTRRGA